MSVAAKAICCSSASADGVVTCDLRLCVDSDKEEVFFHANSEGVAMKRTEKRQGGTSKMVAGVFAFLLLIQTFALSAFSVVPSYAGDHQGIERDAVNLCERAGDAQSHSGNHCSHIGFCVSCSVQGRGHDAFSFAPIQGAGVIVLFDPTIAGPVSYFENRRLVPARQFGWKSTWSATAPPARA